MHQGNNIPAQKKIRGRIAAFALILCAALITGYALSHHTQTQTFSHPIAWTMVNDILFVAKQKQNTIMQFECFTSEEALVATGVYSIEDDDKSHYYMVRKLYPGPNGLIVQSYIYDKKSTDFVGYRFREYHTLDEEPHDILTIYLKSPNDYPEICYSFDLLGRHLFVNNCASQYNLWRIAPEGNVIIDDGQIPDEVEQLGEKNEALSNWAGVVVGPDGKIFVTSGASGQVIRYGADGKREGAQGQIGFGQGRLLAPVELSYAPKSNNIPTRLTVASTGNRTWVQFNQRGREVRTLAPLDDNIYRFPDILVSTVFRHKASGHMCSFDLANRALVNLDDNFAAYNTYLISKPRRTLPLLSIALILLLLVFLRKRLAAYWTNFRFPFFFKLLFLFVPLLVLTALVIGDWVMDVMMTDLEIESRRRSCNLAHAVINTLSIADLEQIRKPEDREGRVYEQIYSTVTRIINNKAVPNTPKWIIHKIRDGHFYFGINIWRGPIYEPYIIPADRKLFFDVLEQGKTQYGRFRDEQGEWLSHLTPIFDANGRIIYVLELYRPTEQIDRTDEKASQRVTRITGVTALFTIILLLIFSYFFTRPLRRLMQGTAYVSEGNFDYELDIHSHDEIGKLAGAFNEMTTSLKRYTTELAKTTAEKEKIESELRIAHEMQQDVLPTTFPPSPGAEGIEIFARMEPAKEIGGDYYDFFMIDENHMGIVVADVSGKGVPAGLFMMEVRTLLRSNAIGTISAAEAIAKVNRTISADNPSVMFVTLFYVICNLQTGELVFCNGGHNPPILAGSNGVRLLSTTMGHGQGVAVGIIADAEYSDASYTLSPGESLVIYTDGVTEPVDRKNRMYGEDRLLKTIEEHIDLANEDICHRIYDNVERHQEGLEQFDDITLLFLKFLGS